MNRFCFYLWIFEQAHADKTRSAFDKSQIIVGVASHDKNIHDSKTLNVAISHANSNRNRNKPIKQAVCDRGYVGANIILPKKALKRDNRYQRDKKRKLY
jgi:IS5 family transposase